MTRAIVSGSNNVAGAWTSYTPTVTGLGAGSGTVVGKYRRIGDSAEIQIYFTKDGTPGSGALEVYFSLPFAADSTKMAGGSECVGTGFTYNIETAAQTHPAVPMTYSAGGYSRVYVADIGAGARYTGAQIAAGSIISLLFTVPIAEWSVPVYLASGADGTSVLNWTSYIPTVGGVTGGVNVATAQYRRVGDSLEVRANVLWSTAFTGGSDLSLTLPTGLTIDSTKVVNASVSMEVGRCTHIDASVGAYEGAVVYGSSTTVKLRGINPADIRNLPVTTTFPFTWVDTDYSTAAFTVPIVGWTAQDYIGKMLVGFAGAQVNQSGLVNNDSSSNVYGTPILGVTNGSAASAGYVGEVLTASLGAVTLTNSTQSYDLGSLTLTKGSWMVYAKVRINNASATHTQSDVSLSLTSVTQNDLTKVRELATALSGRYVMPLPLVVNCSSNTTVYMVGLTYFTGSPPVTDPTNSLMYAVRIR